MALSAIAPGFAQSAPSGTWTAGPGSAGANTYVGRVEAPRAGQSVAGGANLLVSGWAVDTTAQGWSGFDQMQVYNGDRTKSGTKVADGSVGLSRPDIGDALGGIYAKSGFSAVVPANSLPAGADSLYVYLHTPSKGWWYKTVNVNQQAAAAVLPNPIVNISKPATDAPITQTQFLNRYVMVGFALDPNPVTDPANQSKLFGPLSGPGNAGIQSVTLYLDATPGMPGYNSAVNLLGTAGLGIEPLVDNGAPAAGPVHLATNKSATTRAYGPEYEWAGWVFSWNPTNTQADAFHTLYAVAKSSVTGQTATTSSDFYLKSGGGSPSCTAGIDNPKHKGCSILSS